ncbi:MAG: HAD hydrolase family protein [Candidatus Saccharimonadales bacterium]
MKSALPKLAVFDIDGTIAVKGKIPNSVLQGFKDIRAMGCKTTVSTGRGYVRLKHALGDNFDSIVSDGALIVIEHGTKIIDKAGKVIFGAYFDEESINHVVDFVRSNLMMFDWAEVNIDDYSKKIPLSCFEEELVAELEEQRGYYAEVMHTSVGAFKERLLAQPVTNVSLRLRPHVVVDNLKLRFTRTPTDVIFQDGIMSFIKNNTNKSIALSYIANKLDIDIADTLVAGNAINDVEMLGTDAGWRVLVGKPETREVVLGYLHETDQVIEIESVESLGGYLSSLVSS